MNQISLSKSTKALFSHVAKIKPKPKLDDNDKITVSQTVSFFALIYERIRNAVEYREAHLLRRAAVERILRRRLSMNPQGDGEGENLLRELLWARYFDNESLGSGDAARAQHIIDVYVTIREKLMVGQSAAKRATFSQFLFDLMTCEIEESLLPAESAREGYFRYFTFQVLKNKVQIEGASEEEKNASFYVALERALSKSDVHYLRYHLFILSHDPLSQSTPAKLDHIIPQLGAMFDRIEDLIANPYSDRIRRFIKNHIPPFLILFELIKREQANTETIITQKEELWNRVEQICREKYSQSQARFRSMAIKAIIYIFATKMILAFILEYPVSLLLFNEVNYVALIINSLAPPALMLLIVLATQIPGTANTRKIYERMIDIVDVDKEYETSVVMITKKRKIKRPVLVFGFTVFYSLTFIITFGLMYLLLGALQFNFISQAIFLFFMSVVTFFAYRVRQTAKEYQMKEKEAFLRPFVDFFFMPMLSMGKFLSTSLARLNFLTFIFDFLIEAPFKLIIEVVEEWISFVRNKREEIT